MRRSWDHIVRPVLSAARAKTVVEIGAAKGLNTTRLVEWCAANEAKLHTIDPRPGFAVEDLERRFPDSFVMHRLPSLEALPTIPDPNVVLIDGDHNWYTVVNELRTLARWERWPITLLHDVGWPYGRRDMYYTPRSIPAEYRQPFKRLGIIRGRSELSPDGINGRLANARHEGGPRNGVLTAIEDFMRESDDLEFFAASGETGLGLLLHPEHLKGEVGQVLDLIHDPAQTRHLVAAELGSVME
jgi:Methyltransferase domain